MSSPVTRSVVPTYPCRRRRYGGVLAAVFAFGLVAAGCGSGGGGDASSNSATSGVVDAAGDSATTTAAAAGADSTGGTGSEDAGGDACDIVSDEVAAEVLGVEIVRREPGGESGSESVSCIKGSERAADPADFSFVSVGVVAGTLTLVDQMGAQAGSVPVAGLGDRAVYLPSVGGVFIADGSDSIQVQVVQAGVPGGQEDCVTVANDVLERRS